MSKHWMGEILKDYEELGKLAQSIPPAEVWSTAQSVSGFSPDEVTSRVAAHFKLETANLKDADLRILKLIPERLARRYTVFPIQQDDRHLYVATSEPGNIEAEQVIAFASSRSTVFQVAPPNAILEAIDRGYCSSDYTPPLELDASLFLQMTKPANPPEPPKKQMDVPIDAEQKASAGVTMDQMHVLIVDDDPLTRRLAWSILAKQDYRVVEAADGVEALEIVATGTPLALIVLDLNMPRLSGREVLAKLKRSDSTARIPVIVLTASVEDADEAALMEEGADDYIRKPLEPTRFTARIKAVLRRANVLM
jgi:CheY-like chemotaxis protein